MKTLVMLIRREFWEHRVLLWVPLILCVLYLLACVLLSAKVGGQLMQVGRIESTFDEPGSAIAIGMAVVLPIFVSALMAVVLFFYLCDSLYTERKDRSILFWKSLPVSDTKTVLSKMLVALIAVPLFVYVASFATNLLAMMAFKVSTGVELFPSVDGFRKWLLVHWYLVFGIAVLALWYSPIVAYQMLVSVAVPRVPIVWTLLPPIALILGERLLFGTWRIGMFMADRLSGVTATGDGVVTYGRVGSSLASLDPMPLLMRPGLWGGVVVAAVLTYAAIRIRRHRDDS
jgi:ABC-2 type transport system permease protein